MAPWACEQSSITGTGRPASLSMVAGMPQAWVTRTAEQAAGSIAAGSRFGEFSARSAKTGKLPAWNAAVIAEIQVIGDVITPCPGVAPAACKAACSDAVPELNDRARVVPTMAAKASSSAATAGPRWTSDREPDLMSRVTAVISALPYFGFAGKGIVIRA